MVGDSTIHSTGIRLGMIVYKVHPMVFIETLRTIECCVIELVDSISRDGLYMYFCVVHYKTPKISEQVNLEEF